MKKILFFILSCFIACRPVYAMDDKVPKKLVFSKHVLIRMKERGITQSQVIDAIKFGQKSIDKEHPNCFIYCKQINTGKSVTQAGMFYLKVFTTAEHYNRISIITTYIENAFEAEAKEKEKKEKKAEKKAKKEEELKQRGIEAEAKKAAEVKAQAAARDALAKEMERYANAKEAEAAYKSNKSTY
jgi:hypothetical protein